MKKVILNVVLTVVAVAIVGTLFYVGYQESQGNTDPFGLKPDVEETEEFIPKTTEKVELTTTEPTTATPSGNNNGWIGDDEYAEMNAGEYLVSENDGVVTFVKYTGNEPRVKLPTEYNGKTITHIAEGAFSATECEAVYIPDTYQRVCRGAFSDNTYIKEVYIGKEVVEIESMAFGYCRNLQTVTGCQGVKYVSSYAFNSCKKLANTDFDFEKIEIGEKAFEGTLIKIQ